MQAGLAGGTSVRTTEQGGDNANAHTREETTVHGEQWFETMRETFRLHYVTARDAGDRAATYHWLGAILNLEDMRDEWASTHERRTQ
jgi:hypothetical protein